MSVNSNQSCYPSQVRLYLVIIRVSIYFMMLSSVKRTLDRVSYFREEMMSLICKTKLSCGGQLLKEQSLIVAEYSRIANLIPELLHDIELYLTLKVGLIWKLISTRFVPLLICSQIMFLKLKKMLKSILKIHQRNAQHFYLPYWIDCYKGIING